jgi:DNA mismatch repair protein MutL
MSGRIHQLSTQLINKIAAGEVVERPASVVKELLENAIDAGAKSITLRLENGGMQLIEVSDDGSGMGKDDARLAFVQHATSKISSLEDLGAIQSMGFRGEALASIASISSATLHTFDGSSQPVAAKVRNNEILVEQGDARQQGTTVTIRNIFANIPARKKFLRSATTEYKYVYEMFVIEALANPDIGFRLIRDGKPILELRPQDMLAGRVTELFPGLDSNKMLPLSFKKEGLQFSGLIGHPGIATSVAAQQFLFVNKRYVSDRVMNKAVKDGFSSTISRESKPVYFLFLELPPGEVDVNVHPRKLEVRFLQPGQIYHYLSSSIRLFLEKVLQQELYSNFRRNEPEPTRIAGTRDFAVAGPGSAVKPSIEFTRQLLGHNSQPEMMLPELKFDQGSISVVDFNFLQIFNTYLVTEQGSKLLIIDQHAADERVKYEKLQKQFNDNTVTAQALLIPEHYPADEKLKILVQQNLDLLTRTGFKLQIQQGKILIAQIPAILQGRDFLKTFTELISSLRLGKLNLSENSAILDRVLATIACHSSYRAGFKLTHTEGTKLIADLFRCKLPYSCPHGRPIIWEVERGSLEKNFKRKK